MTTRGEDSGIQGLGMCGIGTWGTGGFMYWDIRGLGDFQCISTSVEVVST